MRGRGGVAALAERGTVTAEIAVAVPSVIIVLAACLGGIAASAAQLRAHDAAADAARMLARGESADLARGQVEASVAGSALDVRVESDLVCATVTARPRILGIAVTVSARSCALAGGL